MEGSLIQRCICTYHLQRRCRHRQGRLSA